jgi:uncharacterized cupin superfamily protein
MISRIAVALSLAVGLTAAGFALAAEAGPGTPTSPVHKKPSDLDWVELPEFGGKEAIIYRSPDGKRVAAAFHETGKASFTYPFDEFLVVTSGTVTVTVHGGETFALAKGDVGYFREGTTVDFDFSADFSDITCLMADHEVRWR